MRYPSVKALSQITDDLATAKQLRQVLTATKREQVTTVSKDAADYERSCYSRPPIHLLKLYAANELMRGYGVEGIALDPEDAFINCQTPRVSCDYINQGETYATTLVRMDRDGRISYRVTDWGSIAERYL
jgi:hypothetical protein